MTLPRLNNILDQNWIDIRIVKGISGIDYNRQLIQLGY